MTILKTVWNEIFILIGDGFVWFRRLTTVGIGSGFLVLQEEEVPVTTIDIGFEKVFAFEK